MQFANKNMKKTALALLINTLCTLSFCVYSFSSLSPDTISSDAVASIIKIENIDILESSQETIPDESSLWVKSTLPFKIKRDRKDILHTYYWFKFSIEKPKSSEQFSLYFDKFQLDLKVFLNGKYIGSTHAPEGKHASGWHNPLLINIQDANWTEGANQVAVRLTSGSPTHY